MINQVKKTEIEELNYLVFLFAKNSITSLISRLVMIPPIAGILEGKFVRVSTRSRAILIGSAADVLKTSSSISSSNNIPETTCPPFKVRLTEP